MIFNYLQKILKLTSVVFTVITLFQLVTGTNLDNSILSEFLGLSFVLSLVKLIINKYVIPEDSVFNPLSYIIIVWLMVLSSNYLFNWNISLLSILSTLIEVILIYICVRLINYRYEKIEVQKMNDILDKNRKNEKQ